jgi:hypothetical protein
MDQVRQRLQLKFDELNVLETMLSVGGFDKAYARKLFRDALEDAYIEGYAATEYMLQQEEEMDDELLFHALEKEYDGESIYTKFDDYYEQGDAEKLKVLMDSEFHRVYGQGGLDMANRSGRSVYKTWETMQDDRVRESHDYLEGVTIPIDQKFVTLDMDEADAPGGFTLPENNVNCRCWLSYSAE